MSQSAQVLAAPSHRLISGLGATLESTNSPNLLILGLLRELAIGAALGDVPGPPRQVLKAPRAYVSHSTATVDGCVQSRSLPEQRKGRGKNRVGPEVDAAIRTARTRCNRPNPTAERGGLRAAARLHGRRWSSSPGSLSAVISVAGVEQQRVNRRRAGVISQRKGGTQHLGQRSASPSLSRGRASNRDLSVEQSNGSRTERGSPNARSPRTFRGQAMLILRTSSFTHKSRPPNGKAN